MERNKLTSRKFWLSVAAFLGSIAASVAGITTGEKWVTVAGVVCGMLSAAIYAAAEAYTDGANK
jgi:drug/metabolite transporter (DMT)-like permease